ncbi:site-specific integrase [Mycobacteroides abscessus subsp. abscessus]|uniref:tyrosine-type recombinase/integrase n=1 Tax=Mycobacteroides abscessus TaxID=36809 RepID=UPI000E6A6433|nr:site-specific integrase [Mycobacteroides abscessus]MBN7484533.1 site-specific integrase [Mycobacteroides abscessus subsp. abscessus]MDO3240526.1 site-specific integrase [Mycobacteroides abscessus subsp. abscessus]RIT75020.1 site-specific integrase [Mycobacteroides abscessus]
MGRPPLRVGEHGSITRTNVRPGVWVARCWVRDPDGHLRRVGRQSPRDVYDRHGSSAEDALVAHLTERTAAGPTDITGRTLITDLLTTHLDNLRVAGRAVRTLDTYTLRVEHWKEFGGGLRVQDVTPGVLTHVLDRLRVAHGATTAKQLRTLVTAALDLAVNAGALSTNPARASQGVPQAKRSLREAQGAEPINPDDLPRILDVITGSEECRKRDLTDVLLTHLGTGLRVSEVMGLRWSDLDPETATLEVHGRVVRGKGRGVMWTPIGDSSKGAASVVTLPPTTLAVLLARAAEPRPNKLDLVFPSSVGGLRDPNIVARQWRKVRGTLGEPALERVTGHSFRKTVGTLVADATDVRTAADALGHADTTTTMRHYLMRNRASARVADILEQAMNGARDGEKSSDE